ncbi:MAG: PKD domain-containing protein, partial [Sphingobacteriaceae bacterium]|nr:PKD domain-containing protein [Cytophagaceae bacterium]
MRTVPVLLFSFLCLAGGLSPAKAAPTPGPRFIRNDGQWDPEIRFRADVPGGFLLVKKTSLRYVFFDANALNARHRPKQSTPLPTALDAQAIEVILEGANPDPRAEGLQPDGVPRNYFLGERSAHNVPAFSEVWLREVYPGIDLRLYAHQTTLKYEFVVAAGFSPSAIRLRYDGANALSLENGNLHVAHRFGTMKELAPYSFQDTPNARSHEITSRFLLQKSTVRFQIGTDYDPRLPLVIDPVLIFSTFSGSVADNWGHTATYDAAGNLYSGGSSLDVTGFPATAGAFQVRGGGVWDVAILKYSPDGTRLLYATYLGGSETDVPHSLIVNPQGELVIFGTTSSPNFPTSVSGYDRSFNGGLSLTNNNAPISGMEYVRGSDLYVAKLSADGSRLTGSTYLGGAGNDGLNLNQSLSIQNYGDAYRGEVVTDSLGRVYVASVTASANFPLVNAAQTQRRGSYDAVLLRLSSDLARLEWSTLLGGNGYDAAYGLRVGPSGSVYAVGVTSSTDALAPSLGANSGTFKRQSSGTEDGFVVGYTPALGLGNFSYLGSDDADVAALVDLDKNENVYVLGLSSAGRYPVTSGTYANVGSGQFIQALDKTLSRGLFSTVVGSGRGSPDIVPTAFLVSECGNLYLSGWGGRTNATLGLPLPAKSSTSGLPVTPDAFRGTT